MDYCLISLAFAIAYVLILTGYNYLKPWIRQVYLALQLPGPKGHPILGNAGLVRDSKALDKLGKEVANKYGNIIRIWISFIPTFCIFEPQHIQLVLSNSRHEKNFLYSIMHTFVGKGLITNNGVKWKKNRKLIQPYFAINMLETYINIFAESALISVKTLMVNGKKEVNIVKCINECVIDILHCAILGIPIDPNERQKKMDSPFRHGKVVVPYRISKPWLLISQIYNRTNLSTQESQQKQNLQTFVKDILDNKSNYANENYQKNMKFKCMLDIFKEIQEKDPSFTEEDIINEACTFMLAGQDSVGAAAAFGLYAMANNPEIQEKVFKELQEVFSDDDLIDNPITVEELHKLTYLEKCVRETMRLYPSVPIIARRLVEDVKIDKYVFPKGSNIFISPYATHRLSHIYPEPEKFDPDRFNAENLAQMHPYSFLTFSGGPRNCIGYKFAILEVKTIMATILRTFEVSLKPGYEVTVGYRLTLRAKGGILLNVKPRRRN